MSQSQKKKKNESVFHIPDVFAKIDSRKKCERVFDKYDDFAKIRQSPKNVKMSWILHLYLYYTFVLLPFQQPCVR